MKPNSVRIYMLTCIFLCGFLIIVGQETVQVKVDFGSSNSPSEGSWNNTFLPKTGSLNQLKDSNGFITTISLVISDQFNGINQSGTNDPEPSINIPSTASGDSFFGNIKEFSGVVEPTGAILLSGLTPEKPYNLSFFASRLTNDNRETKYVIEGAIKDSSLLAVSNNVSDLVNFNAVLPNSEGNINITLSPGPNNDNEFSFYYIGAMILEYEDDRILDPQLSIKAPNGGEFWQTNKSPEIRWESQDVASVELSYTVNGQDWQIIDSVDAFSGKYEWNIPSINSTSAKVRVRSNELVSISNFDFTMNNDSLPNCHIVVLGSSTAAGSGPSTRDSAWVWRYRDYLFQNDTRFSVTNLARGGFTTYNILPDDAIIPDSINKTIDSLRNVSRALDLSPNGVIINLPSNDAANGFSVADQLYNYDLILEDLSENEIPYWVCTPQARNNFTIEKVQIQRDLVDSTFARFGLGAIDFWSGFANNDGSVMEVFDSGDGVHLNDVAHRILLERVLNAGVRDSLLSIKTEGSVATIDRKDEAKLTIYPNPCIDQLNIKWDNKFSSNLQIEFYNENLDTVKSISKENIINNDNDYSVRLGHLQSGIYFMLIKDRDNNLIVGRQFIKL